MIIKFFMENKREEKMFEKILKGNSMKKINLKGKRKIKKEFHK